jgi:hypothetical protein
MGRGRMLEDIQNNIYFIETGVAGVARESFPGFRRFIEWKDRQILLR